ncbi:2,3-bisphosphoglycerate-independent phosphoglycerate mutase [Candidatus Gottesmanbacteria bacterium]|nr:2,3-bisphosphoglycerate-independent phosphoglycerate mutase [Candidatus Gottesmanbacteria bacterium]
MVKQKFKPVVLVVLDGWGISVPGEGNAVTRSKTPNFTRFSSQFPHTELRASGESVGLPHGEPGNSEVGHLNLGAGRIVYQDEPRINMAIADGGFVKNPAFIGALAHCQEQNSRLHLMGLIGAGAVHSNINHLFALLWLIKQNGFKNPVFLHLFTDGRDSPPTSASIYLREVEDKIKELHLGKIATISGRYYAMDRDNRWERTQKAYQAIVENSGEKAASAEEALTMVKQRGETDEFIKPTIIDNPGANGNIKDNDAVIFFNYRTDRPRQLTKAIVLPNFESINHKRLIYDHNKDRYMLAIEVDENSADAKTFTRKITLNNLFFVTMTQYEKDLPINVAFPPQPIPFPLAAVISSFDLRQLHISETEKYAHVTYFFNGGREDPYPGEDRIHIPSPKVATYDLTPEMSAFEITSVCLQRLNQNYYDFMIINFANPDMIGHTGNINATIKACEVVDSCLGEIGKKVLSQNGALIITADHGNAEEMINRETKEVDTYHSANPVPFIIGCSDYNNNPQVLGTGILADVAPTILKLMGLPISSHMTGRVLI